MVAQRQELAVHRQNFIYVPNTFDEAMKYATTIAASGLCPASVRGKPSDVFIILQTGAELGLQPMQALRTLGVINGMPFAYGDGLLALVKRHRDFVDIKEWLEGNIESGTLTAYCTIKRKNQEPVTRPFSIEDAIRAKLWDKKNRDGSGSTWTLYAKRMLQHRARGYAAKDSFPDAIFGLMSEDEAYNVAESQKVTPIVKKNSKGMAGLEESLGIAEDVPAVIEGEFVETQPSPVVSELMGLLIEKNVPEKSIEKWCKKFNVSVIQDIPLEGMETIIKHLKKMERD